jgi:hypothetical protein
VRFSNHFIDYYIENKGSTERLEKILGNLFEINKSKLPLCLSISLPVHNNILSTKPLHEKTVKYPSLA